MKSTRFLLCLFAAVTPASASTNGLCYKCDATKLAAEDMCYFVPTLSDTCSETMTPHNIDRSVAEDGFRQVSDAVGSPHRISPKPWTQGDKLTKSDALLADDMIAYANIFELVAPLRDAMMYDPKTLTDERWGVVTKGFVDCKVKEQDTTMQKGDKTMTVYGVAGVYALVKKAAGADTHHSILQFLEESAIDLVCLTVPTLKMDHCDKIRATMGVTTEPSTCWHQAYEGVYGKAPRVKGAETEGSDAGNSDAGNSDATESAGSDVTSDAEASDSDTTEGAKLDATNAGTASGVAFLSLCVGALLAQ